MRDPFLNSVGGIGGRENPVLRVPVQCKAKFTLEDFEAFGLGEVEMEGWGLGRLVECLCSDFPDE